MDVNLTEYELVDLAVSMQETVTPPISVFITILSGYLVVAWLIGAKLTRTQVGLINALFIGFQVMLVLSWGGRWEFYFRLANALHSFDPDFYAVTHPAIVSVFGILMVASIVGCLKFMWDIRHPKTE